MKYTSNASSNMLYYIILTLFFLTIIPVKAQIDNTTDFKRDLAFKYNLFRETLICIYKHEGKGYSNELISFAKTNKDNGDELTLLDLEKFNSAEDQILIFRCQYKAFNKVGLNKDTMSSRFNYDDEKNLYINRNRTLFEGIRKRHKGSLE